MCSTQYCYIADSDMYNTHGINCCVATIVTRTRHIVVTLYIVILFMKLYWSIVKEYLDSKFVLIGHLLTRFSLLFPCNLAVIF